MQDEPLPLEGWEQTAETPGDLCSAESLLALTQLPRVGSGRALKLARHFGSWESLLEASPEVVRSVAGATVDIARLPVAEPTEGVRLVGWFDPDYPHELNDLKDPPAVLWIRGELGPAPRLAVVGTRNPTRWGQQVAGLVAASAAERGVSVVSGLALGIDIAAHRAACREGGHTIAVLGGGVDVPSPKGHAADADRILEQGGALLSEVRPGTTPSARTLVARNRLQAALSAGTVMVQCGLDSGTMHTARFTVALDRPLVVAVPPASEAEMSENAGNQSMLGTEASTEAPRASFALRSPVDLDEMFGLLRS